AADRSRSAPAPVGGLDALAGTAVALARGLFPLEKPVRLLGVTVSGFEAAEPDPGTQAAFDFRQASDTGSLPSNPGT
ncbi:hypothetical protein, partial [Phenylobacterium sp.]|uniref:DinB/UmuC family translesion DNA polymerase n=1 Tax=Phenylobacterium sp. TaxID=1871053 RepID=UPI0035C6A121